MSSSSLVRVAFVAMLAFLPGPVDADVTSVVAGLTVGETSYGIFPQVENLGSRSDVKTRPNGSVRVGAVLWSPVVLKRAVSSERALWEWRQQVIDGGAESARRPASITLFDQTAMPIATWQLEAAWPSSLSVVVESGVALEVLEITHEGMRRQE